jgi:hypothetical protein
VEKRVLIIFSQDPSFIDEQKMLLNNVISGLLERDMILFGFSEEQPPYSTEQSINLEIIQKKLSIDDNTIVLLGKDGYVKAKWRRTVDPQTIFKIIDSMPMRQSEMRNR